MSKQEEKKVSKIKVKKKNWYRIVAPALFGGKELGESYLAEAEQAIGRVLRINLKDLTGNVKDQNTYIGFRVDKVDGKSLITSVVSYQLTPAYVRRVVRKNIDRLDDYCVCMTKDGKAVVTKTLMVTLCKTKRSVRAALRHQLPQLLKEEMAKMTFDEFVGALAGMKIQSMLKKRLAKIYPLKELSVRMLFLKEKNLTAEIPTASPIPEAVASS